MQLLNCTISSEFSNSSSSALTSLLLGGPKVNSSQELTKEGNCCGWTHIDGDILPVTDTSLLPSHEKVSPRAECAEWVASE